MQVQKGQQNKNSGTKTAKQKLVVTLGHWVTGTLSASAKRSAEQKQQKKNSLMKIGGDPQTLSDGDPKCTCKKVSGTKIGGDPWRPQVQVQKGQQNKNWWGPLETPSASAKRSAEQKQQNKNRGIKIGGDPQTLGDGDPKCTCKKVSGTKTAEQKQWNKNWWGPLGTPSASAKRSAERKLVGPLGTLSASAKRSAEQKSGTKTVEKNSRIKIGGDPQTLGDWMIYTLKYDRLPLPHL